MNAEIAFQCADRFTIEGVLDFTTVSALLPRGLALFDGTTPSVVFDLADVTQANSAGLALLLEWVDQAQRRGVSLHFAHLPASLASIARVTYCSELLPLED